MPKVFTSLQPGGADPADRRADLPPGPGHRLALGEQHRERCLPHGQDRRGLLPGGGPLVLGAGLHGTVDVRRRRRCPTDFKKIPLEHERSRVLASVPGTDQAAEAVLVAQIPQTARVNKKELEGSRAWRSRAIRSSSRSRQTTVRARREHRQGRLQGRRSYYMCYQGVWFVGQERRRARGKSPAPCPRRSTRSPSALPRIT